MLLQNLFMQLSRKQLTRVVSSSHFFMRQKPMLFVQKAQISNFFVAPVLQERKERQISVTDTKEIFDRVKKEYQTLSYNQALDMLSDLAYIIVPFDKTQSEFQQLIGRLKLTLQNQTGNVKMYELIDACTRLGIDYFNGIIRQKVQEGNYSRSPADLCALLYFFTSQHRQTHAARDVELFTTVLPNLTHMQVHALQMEHLEYLLHAFTFATEPSFLHALPNSKAHFQIIEDFLPKLVEQAVTNELNRCKLTDIITLMESFYRLWDKNAFKNNSPIKKVFSNCEMYLSEYLGKSKKDITGSEFAKLVHLIALAQESGLHKFEQKILHNLQHIFLNDNADLYVFSMGDILKMFRGFEQINEYFNKDKVIQGLVELILEGRIYEDEAFLDVLLECQKRGLIEKYQDLGVKARVYFQERFDFMERPTILGFLQLFKELGLLFNDKEVALLMKENLSKSYHAYDLPELFQAYKLLSHNFYRDPESFQLLEDAIKIRTSEPNQRQAVKAENVRDLIEGLKLLSSGYNKRMDASLRTLLKSSPLMESDKKLFVQYVTYASDFEVKIDEEMGQKISSALEVHCQNLTDQDKVHLKLYGQNVIPQELLDQLQINTDQIKDQDTIEKLALIGLGKLDGKRAMEGLEEIDKECNLLEVIEQSLKERGVKYQGRQLVCDGRLRAAFVIQDEKAIVDVIDQQLAYYTKDGQRRLKLRGRIADQLAKQYGFSGGYKLVSLVEMDFAKDEQEFINQTLFNEQTGEKKQQLKMKFV